MIQSLQPFTKMFVLLLSIIASGIGTTWAGEGSGTPSSNYHLPVLNSVQNAEFDEGTTGWQLADWSGTGYSNGGNSFSVVTGAGMSGVNALYVDVVNNNNEGWTIQPKQILNFDLVVGRTYSISFMAKAETSRVISAAVRGEESDIDYWNTEVSLTTNVQTFTFQYTCTNTSVNAESDFSIAFYLAKGVISDVWIDRVIIEDITAPTAVTGVEVSPATLTLSPEQTSQLDKSIFPFNATNKNVTWTSSNPSVATVSMSGLVSAISAGSATITIKTDDGDFTDTCVVTVQPSINGIQNPEFNSGTLNWALGDWSGPNYSNGGNSFSTVTNGGLSGTNALHVDVVNNNNDNWTLQARQVLNFRIEPGKTYSISFMAKAQANRTMGVAIHGETSDTDPWSENVNLTSSPQSFTFQYVCNDSLVNNEAEFALAFYLARGVISDVWIDKVSIQDVTSFTPVTGINILAEAVSLSVGQTNQLTATITPSNATNQTVDWVSSSPGVATVNSLGLVTAISLGTATITATTVDGSFSDTSLINVGQPGGNGIQNPEFDLGTSNWALGDWSGTDFSNGGNSFSVVTNAGLSGTNALLVNIVNTNNTNWTIQPKQLLNFRLQEGKTYAISFMAKAESNRTIDAALRGEDSNIDYWMETVNLTTTGQTFNFQYTCNNSMAIAEGTFALAFYLAKGVISDVWIDKVVVEDITSIVSVTGVSLERTTLTLSGGSSWKLGHTVSPSNATNKSVSWTSTNPSVATVDNQGLVTAVSVGTTTINVTTLNGSFSAPCEITVKDYSNASGILELFAFQYSYDSLKRMTHKKVPGAGWVYMVYDSRDRLVMTQDAEQRKGKQWTFTKYDALDRPILTGIYVDTAMEARDQQTMQRDIQLFYTSAETNSDLWFEQRDAVHAHGYTNRTFPDVSIDSAYLTVTYYDDYEFLEQIGVTAENFYYDKSQLPQSGTSTGQPSKASTRIRGQVTGTKTKNLDTNEFLLNVTYYDDRYRVIQMITQNNKGGIDKTTNVYDFTGKVLKTKADHSTTGANIESVAVMRNLSYDHTGRLLQVQHQTATPALPTSEEIVLLSNEYNELGQLVAKNLYSDDGTNYKQKVDYRYNIRGWLTRINDSELSTADGGPKDYFGMELGYNDPLGLSTSEQYNGNISAIKWSTNLGLGLGFSPLENFEPTSLGYIFTYDPMNRLKKSEHFENTIGWSASSSFHENIEQYDLNGNIKELKRTGKGGNSMDLLNYESYRGNQLLKVVDMGNDYEGFKDGNTSGDDYIYDDNGNMITDKNKDIATIEYNYLNLPTKVIKDDGQYVKYVYNAAGVKLRQEVYDSLSVLKKKTDYLGEFYYENDTLRFINHEEGRIVMTDSIEYQYTLKDHLGNTRITFTTNHLIEPFSATMDVSKQNDEKKDFEAYNSYVMDALDPTPNENEEDRILVLNGSTLTSEYNGQVGLTKSFAVVPGDKIIASVNVKYFEAGGSGNLANFAASLLQAFALTPSNPIEGISPFEALNNFGAIIASGGRDGEEELPQGFLNILVFDKNYELIDTAFHQVGTSNTLARSVEIRQPGYVYVFLSNDGVNQQQIGFDNYMVTHEHSDVIQQDDYYPFGLTFNSYQRENSTKQNYLYNGKEKQDELDLGWYDYGKRMYQSEIGRWNAVDPSVEHYESISPYAYTFNNPIRFIDIKGSDPGDVVVIFAGGDLSSNRGLGSTGDIASGLREQYFNDRGGAVQNFPSTYWDTKVYGGQYGPVAGVTNTMDGGLDAATQEAYDYVLKNYASGGRVVVYGYSYGGVLASHLEKRLKENKIQVDFLVTVDAAAGPQSDQVDRVVSDNTKENLNIFQTTPSSIGSRGGENKRSDGSKKGVTNSVKVSYVDDKGKKRTMTHGIIDDQSATEVIQAILEKLNKKDDKKK